MFFEPEKVEDVGGFEPVAAGWYKVIVGGTAVKATKSGNGTVCSVRLNIIEGPSAKRVLFANFNITHSNPEAERIGKGQFKRFLKAVGITTPIKDAQEAQAKLDGKFLYVLVAIGKHYQSGEPTNEVKDYSAEAKAPPIAAKAAAPADQIPF